MNRIVRFASRSNVHSRTITSLVAKASPLLSSSSSSSSSSLLESQYSRNTAITFIQKKCFSSKKNGKHITPVEVEEEEEEDEDDAEPMDLAEVLTNEIAEEAANDTVDAEINELIKDVKKTYKISETLGLNVVTLTRKFKDESIVITFDIQDEEELESMEDPYADMENEERDEDSDDKDKNDDDDAQEDDENDDSNLGDDLYGTHFTITISKPEGKVVFKCMAASDLRILNVQHLAAGKNETDEGLYRGPQFDYLDDAVKDATFDYLNDRGINDDLCYFILKYSRDKEQKEYLNWLNQLLKFTDEVKK